MIRFTIYTYLFKPINSPMEKDLFLPDVNVADSMRDKQTIFGSFFMHDSKLKFKSNGDKPMTITWAMQNNISGFILDKAQKMAVG